MARTTKPTIRTERMTTFVMALVMVLITGVLAVANFIGMSESGAFILMEFIGLLGAGVMLLLESNRSLDRLQYYLIPMVVIVLVITVLVAEVVAPTPMLLVPGGAIGAGFIGARDGLGSTRSRLLWSICGTVEGAGESIEPTTQSCRTAFSATRCVNSPTE